MTQYLNWGTTLTDQESEAVRSQVPVKRVEEFIRLDRPGKVAQCVAIQMWNVLKYTSIYVVNGDDLVQDGNAASRKRVFNKMVAERASS